MLLKSESRHDDNVSDITSQPLAADGGRRFKKSRNGFHILNPEEVSRLTFVKGHQI